MGNVSWGDYEWVERFFCLFMGIDFNTIIYVLFGCVQQQIEWGPRLSSSNWVWDVQKPLVCPCLPQASGTHLECNMHCFVERGGPTEQHFTLGFLALDSFKTLVCWVVFVAKAKLFKVTRGLCWLKHQVLLVLDVSFWFHDQPTTNVSRHASGRYVGLPWIYCSWVLPLSRCPVVMHGQWVDPPPVLTDPKTSVLADQSRCFMFFLLRIFIV